MEEVHHGLRDLAEEIRSESRQLRRQNDAASSEPGGPQCLLFRPETPPPPTAPERIYVYAPREVKCSRFSGDRHGCGGRVEDWITEVRKALVGRPLSASEQVAWVYELLDGEAKREVTFSLDIERTQVEAIFSVLLEHFGCDQTYVAIQRQFFHRRQGQKETLREFTQALVDLLQQLQTKDPRVVPLPDMVLRDTFIENVFSLKLHQELTQALRAHPERSFKEMRDIALQWERRQVTLGNIRPRTVDSHDPPPAAAQAVAVNTQSTTQVSKELQECREALRKQQLQLDAILQHLTAPPAGSGHPLAPRAPRPAPRRPPLPFQEDGTPICLRCREPGHIAKWCPRIQPLPTAAHSQLVSQTGNLHPPTQ